MPGVFISEGMNLRIPSFSITVDENGLILNPLH